MSDKRKPWAGEPFYVRFVLLQDEPDDKKDIFIWVPPRTSQLLFDLHDKKRAALRELRNQIEPDLSEPPGSEWVINQSLRDQIAERGAKAEQLALKDVSDEVLRQELADREEAQAETDTEKP